MSIIDRLEISTQAKKRVALMRFGDPVTNVCAGESNPQRHSCFVEAVTDAYTNKQGIRHESHFVKCTDRNGKFWLTGRDVIFPGTLDIETCRELFAPIHAAQYPPQDSSHD